MYVAHHCPSATLVVVKQTNVDVQNTEQLEDLKVCKLIFIIAIISSWSQGTKNAVYDICRLQTD